MFVLILFNIFFVTGIYPYKRNNYLSHATFHFPRSHSASFPRCFRWRGSGCAVVHSAGTSYFSLTNIPALVIRPLTWQSLMPSCSSLGHSCTCTCMLFDICTFILGAPTIKYIAACDDRAIGNILT
ncbi:hypothetical protein EV426DRAFT_593413 [Tirmania nivea]|nr:hypothetical protein EV426DRAFT_593413 [Tirmania nivea]